MELLVLTEEKKEDQTIYTLKMDKMLADLLIKQIVSLLGKKLETEGK